MTRENAHLFLPLIQAIQEGKTIEEYYPMGVWRDSVRVGDWGEIKGTIFDKPPEHYRIKPDAPKATMIPLAPEDLPSPCWVKSPPNEDGPSLYSTMITGIGTDEVWFGASLVSFSSLQSQGWIYAPSHLGPWKKCEKEAK